MSQVLNAPFYAEVPPPVFRPGPVGTHITIRGLTKYFAPRKLIVCPVHNASFDPFKKGAVVAGPAITALPSVKVAVKGGWIVVL